MTNARSIHIGLNNVDPDGYNGWDGQLSGCVNDANDMQAIADGLGYTSLLLIDSDANCSRVISEIGQAADDLQSGDILFLSYSGHGGQVNDVNGDEDDALDETWCLWDRQLIDDELYCLWSRFKPGVRIVVLSDSCHSGTVLRMLRTLEDLTREVARTRAAPTGAQKATLDTLTRALGIDLKDVAEANSRGAKKAPPKAAFRSGPTYRGAAAAVAVRQTSLFGTPRRVPADVQTLVNQSRAQTNAAAQWLAGPSERATIGATVILISGCQDDQLSMDGAGNGLFTEKLKLAWNDGAFSGGYKAFWSAIKSSMPAKQQPNYQVVGCANSKFEAQTPFEIGDGSSSTPATPSEPSLPSEPSESGGTRPTLQLGATGGDVEYLQQRLLDLGYNVDVDGAFGPGTASAVRSFQSANGLPVDGVVGPATWEVLG